jgi:hypothetical protein
MVKQRIIKDREGYMASQTPDAQEVGAAPSAEAMLPLGTVLKLQGSDKPVMVISRGVVLERAGQREWYKYGACLWPEGSNASSMACFNDEQIGELLFCGYADDQEHAYTQTLGAREDATTIPAGVPQEVTEQTLAEVEQAFDDAGIGPTPETAPGQPAVKGL